MFYNYKMKHSKRSRKNRPTKRHRQTKRNNTHSGGMFGKSTVDEYVDLLAKNKVKTIHGRLVNFRNTEDKIKKLFDIMNKDDDSRVKYCKKAFQKLIIILDNDNINNDTININLEKRRLEKKRLYERNKALYELFGLLYNDITNKDYKIELDKLTIVDETFQTYKRKYNSDKKRMDKWVANLSLDIP